LLAKGLVPQAPIFADQLAKDEDLVAVKRVLAEVYWDMSRVFAARGNALETERYLMATAHINPDDIQSRLALVQLYQQQGREGDAQERLQQLNALQGQDFESIPPPSPLTGELSTQGE
jgi:hypothetical protein